MEWVAVVYHTSTPPLSFYRPSAFPAAQLAVSKHWRQYFTCIVAVKRWSSWWVVLFVLAVISEENLSVVDKCVCVDVLVARYCRILRRIVLYRWDVTSARSCCGAWRRHGNRGAAAGVGAAAVCDGRAVCAVAAAVSSVTTWRPRDHALSDLHRTARLVCTLTTHTPSTSLCPGLPGSAGTRKVKPIWKVI